MRRGPIASLVVVAALVGCDTVAFQDHQSTTRPFDPPCDVSSDCPKRACTCANGSTFLVTASCVSQRCEATSCTSACGGSDGDEDFGTWLLGGEPSGAGGSGGFAGSGASGSGPGGKAGAAGAAGGATCAPGAATKVGSLVAPRPSLVVIGADVFAIDGSSVVRVTSGGPAVVGTPSSPPKWLAVIGTALLVATVDGVHVMPSTGGASTKIASATGVRALAPVGTTAFVYGWGLSGFPLTRVPFPAGTPTSLTGNQTEVLGLAASGSVLAWTAKSTLGFRVWAGSSAAPSTPVQLADVEDFVDTATFGAQSVGTDGSFVYWVDTTTNALVRAPAVGGAKQALAPAVATSPSRLVLVDGGKVYFVDHPTGCSGAVVSVAKTGGAVTTIAGGQTAAAFATDATNLYWLSGKDVFRAPK